MALLFVEGVQNAVAQRHGRNVLELRLKRGDKVPEFGLFHNGDRVVVSHHKWNEQVLREAVVKLQK